MPAQTKSPKAKDATLLFIAFFVVVIVIRGYAVIYPYALEFVKSRPTVPVGEQGFLAQALTIVFQFLCIHFFWSCYWSFKLLERGSLNPFFPIFYALTTIPFLIVVTLAVF